MIITGDLNGKVGRGTTEEREVLGKHGTGDRYENDERLCDFCDMNGLVIIETIFIHKEIPKATWTSPNGRNKNQIENTIIAKEYRSVMDTGVRRGSDVGSDQERKPREKEGQTIFDVKKLAKYVTKTTLRSGTDFRSQKDSKKKKMPM